MNSVFITGASGLLGLETARQLSENNFIVIGQYYKNKPKDLKNCKWIKGDFKTLRSLDIFLQKNKIELLKCRYIINCYGPITYKNNAELKTEHFKEEIFSNLIIPIKIINFFLKQEQPLLSSIINIGFELSGQFKPVKNVLPYMMAKNALLQYTISMALTHKKINFNMVSPVTLEGAKFPSKNGKTIPINIAAQTIIKTLFGKISGENILI